MATYTSRFNLNDTAYTVNADLLVLDTVIITDIRVRESINLSSSPSSYVVTYRGRTNSTQKEFSESELVSLEEGKLSLEILIAQKITAVRSI